jgi:hypothetical protein
MKTAPMTLAEARAARAIVSAFEALAYNARAFDAERLDANVDDLGPVVHVRHPITKALVAIVSVVEGALSITFAVPFYRPGVVAAVHRARRHLEEQITERKARR